MPAHIARHLGKHISGKPNIIVQNVPAAGGMVLANQLYATAPRDGSYVGMIRGTVVHEQVLQNRPRFNSMPASSFGLGT